MSSGWAWGYVAAVADLTLTVLTSDGPLEVSATGQDGAVFLSPDALLRATGWESKPEGLCRADVCVPLRGDTAVDDAGRLDLAKVTAALRLPLALEVGDGAAAVVGEAVADRQAVAASGQAPDFDVEGVTGGRVRLSDHVGKKVLLLAWASW